ncbi:hypothetical protein [Arthrobacter sp. 2MCAF14]|uniref:hypothetical protein n=1 Tax=Arthrobacter sp. 2MCAF14 TaxID=3232982 RepID=UPI003F904128
MTATPEAVREVVRGAYEALFPMDVWAEEYEDGRESCSAADDFLDAVATKVTPGIVDGLIALGVPCSSGSGTVAGYVGPRSDCVPVMATYSYEEPPRSPADMIEDWVTLAVKYLADK